ncbi:MAG: hypothetical protein ACOYLX_05535 [Burkholderiaceae bacterium]
MPSAKPSAISRRWKATMLLREAARTTQLLPGVRAQRGQIVAAVLGAYPVEVHVEARLFDGQTNGQSCARGTQHRLARVCIGDAAQPQFVPAPFRRQTFQQQPELIAEVGGLAAEEPVVLDPGLVEPVVHRLAECQHPDRQHAMADLGALAEQRPGGATVMGVQLEQPPFGPVRPGLDARAQPRRRGEHAVGRACGDRGFDLAPRAAAVDDRSLRGPGHQHLGRSSGMSSEGVIVSAQPVAARALRHAVSTVREIVADRLGGRC